MVQLKQRARLWSNIAIAVGTALATCQIMFGWGSEGGLLLSSGIGAFKYFTVLSNIFSGGVAAVFAVRLGLGREIGPGLMTLKLAATTSVGLTFLTVVVFLAPKYGLLAMYIGANLWLHLLLPLMAMVGFCLVETGDLLPRATLLATIPMILYGAGYYANIVINGVGEPPHVNDFYGFAQWGMDRTPVVFVVIAVITWGIALVHVLLRGKIQVRCA